jgi:CRP-like cAMP-binding protein
LAVGDVLIREGEQGDCFYAIADGRLEVTIGGLPIATKVRGDGVGEIALLYNLPRTATVTAASPATVFALTRARRVPGRGGRPRPHRAGGHRCRR